MREFYRKYDKTSQDKGSFGQLPSRNCNSTYHTWYSKQNRMTEKRDGTLMNIVRNMTNKINMPEQLGSEGLKRVVYILNRVPNNLFLNTF